MEFLTKLETGSKHIRCHIAYAVDNGSEGNLLPVDSYRKLFPNTTKEQLSKSGDRHIVLQA